MAEYLRYTVKRGDTLGKIASANDTSVGELVALNAIANPNSIEVGQILNIRRLSTTSYVVQRGDRLSAIAAHYGVTVAEIVKANNIANPNLISVGMTLVIPTMAPESPWVPPAPTPAAAAAPVPSPGKTSIAAAKIARNSVRSRSAGRCYRYVKQALLAGGAVDHYLGGAAANEAGPELIAQGFVDILNMPAAGIKSPYDAPVGAVIVYKATPTATDKNRIYGHIEIRTADGFASDYYSPRARTGAKENGLVLNSSSGRAVSGVFVKPDAKPAAAPASPPPPPPAPPEPPAPPPVQVDPYSVDNLGLPAVNGKYQAAIIEAAQRTGIAPQAIAAIIDAEAAKIAGTGQWNANSKASTSSATGLTQFLDGTWRGEARRGGSLLNAEAKNLGLIDAANAITDDRRLLNLRFDPRISILAGADFAVSNLAILRNANVLPAELAPGGLAKIAYVAHHEGAGRAIRFIRGDMAYVKTSILSANVPNATRRQALIDAAGGNVGTAYRNWFTGYVDTNIDVRRFMLSSDGVTVPKLSSYFL